MSKNKPWHRHYDEGVLPTLQPYPRATLMDVVKETARDNPQHPALIFKGTTMSYGLMDTLSDAFASFLVDQGIKKGDRIALLLVNSPQAIITQLGIWKAGAIAVPLNPLYTRQELEHALTESGAKVAVVLTPFYNKVKSIQPHLSPGLVIATNIKEYLPFPTRLLFTLAKEKREGHRISLEGKDMKLKEILARHRGSSPNMAVYPEDPSLLLFTGGTTGIPKGALSNHRGLLISGMQLKTWFSPIMKEWEDRIMLNMPLFHTYGSVGVLATCIMGRNPMVLVPNPRDMDDLIETIKKTRPAFLPGTPTLLIALLNHPKVQRNPKILKSIKLCISAAAPLMAETRERFQSLTGGRVVEGYALTESVMASVVGPVKGKSRPGAVGLPLPDVEIRIAHQDTGEGSLPPEEVGEILIRAPQIMEGYWKNPGETAAIIREGWLYTGDLGYLDHEGFLYIVDRKKDLIKPGGFQVWPREVEEVISTHPAVAEVGVAGVPDEYQGEAVKAWIVLGKGKKASAEEIRAYCRERLVAYKVPKHVEFRESLPKTLVGKVLRRELTSPKQ